MYWEDFYLYCKDVGKNMIMKKLKQRRRRERTYILFYPKKKNIREGGSKNKHARTHAHLQIIRRHSPSRTHVFWFGYIFCQVSPPRSCVRFWSSKPIAAPLTSPSTRSVCVIFLLLLLLCRLLVKLCVCFNLTSFSIYVNEYTLLSIFEV